MAEEEQTGQVQFDPMANVRGGPLTTLAIPVPMDNGGTAVRLMIAHAGGHDDHVLDPDLAAATGRQLVEAAEAARERNRTRIETFGPDALRGLPPANGGPKR